MKRTVIFIVAICIATVAFADTIGENFEAGSAIVGGSANFYSNLNGYWEVSAYPWMDFPVADGFLPGVGFGASLDSDGDYSVSVSPGASLTFAYDPEAQSGAAHQVGLRSTVRLSGSSGTGMSLSSLNLYPYYRLYLFLVPRIAPYLYLDLFGVNFVGGVSLWTNIDLTIGIAFFLPTRDKSLAGAKN